MYCCIFKYNNLEIYLLLTILTTVWDPVLTVLAQYLTHKFITLKIFSKYNINTSTKLLSKLTVGTM